ncbi:MAG: LTA synthase family protein [Clostridia bacterium]|nr:LTA synthase family protein [Clostridia bacterium]
MERKKGFGGFWKRTQALLLGEERPLLRRAVAAALFALSLLLLDLGFRGIYFQADTSPLGGEVPLFFTLSWIAILSAVPFFLPRLGARIYQIAVFSVYGIFTVVHAFLYSLFGDFFTLSAVVFAGDGADFFDWSYFSIPKKYIALLLFCLGLAILSAILLPKTRYTPLSLGLAGGVLVLGIAGNLVCHGVYITEGDEVMTWDGDAAALSPADVNGAFTDTNKCLHMLGLYQYTFRDLSIFTGLDGLFNQVSTAEIEAYYEGRIPDADNEMTGVLKGKNLILIQMESIDTWMVNPTAMPFFSELRERSVNFSNFYTPKFLSTAATFNTELIVNCGIVPPVNSTFAHFSENRYPYAMANLFREAGYAAESYHRSNPGIYNRGEVHTNWGYEAYNTGAAMGMENVDLDTDLMAGYEMFVKDERFFSFLITYSGHGPYRADSTEVQRYYDEIRAALPEAKEEYLWALCHARETDEFLRALYTRLEKEGRLEDTVLIFYSDHYDHYLTDKELLAECKGTSDPNLMSCVPFVIHSPALTPTTVTSAVASYDILPTVVNLFDLPYDGRHYFGRDAFSDGEGYTVFENGSWYDGETYFNVDESVPTPLSRRRAEEIEKRLLMNQSIVRTDYFAKMKNQ